MKREALAGGIDYLKAMQRPLLERIGHDNLDHDTLARYGLALMIEVAEATNETSWKAWRTRPADLDRVREEWADIFAFIGVWMLLLEKMGISTEDLAREYDMKNEENHRRFNGEVEGYGLARDSGTEEFRPGVWTEYGFQLGLVDAEDQIENILK